MRRGPGGPGPDLGQAWSSPPAFLVRDPTRLGCAAPSPLVPPPSPTGITEAGDASPEQNSTQRQPESPGYQAPTAELTSARMNQQLLGKRKI